MARRTVAKRSTKARRRTASPADGVMRAFRLAKSSAPAFMSSCGVFPEVSEVATDRLHFIVNDVATRGLNKQQHLRALQSKLQRLARAAGPGARPGDIVERIDDALTALLASEAVAAYLFGLSVGMTVRSLPDTLDR